MKPGAIPSKRTSLVCTSLQHSKFPHKTPPVSHAEVNLELPSPTNDIFVRDTVMRKPQFSSGFENNQEFEQTPQPEQSQQCLQDISKPILEDGDNLNYKILYLEACKTITKQRSTILNLRDDKHRVQKAKRKLFCQNKTLREKIKLTVIESESKTRDASKKACGDNAFLQSVAKNLQRSKFGRRYSVTHRNWSIALFMASRKSYRILSEIIAMPTPRTIKNWLHDIALGSGLNEGILQAMKIAVDKMPYDHRCVGLSFDGTSLAEYFAYHAKSDSFDGLPDVLPNLPNDLQEEQNDENDLANHVIIFGVRGLKINFKQIFGYHFVKNSMTAQQQVVMIHKCIAALRDVGLIVKSITCDQYTVNVQTFKLLGVTQERPTFVDHFGTTIVCFYDAPHLLKNARTNLYKHNCLFKGKVCSWKHIIDLLNIDMEEPLRLVRKITPLHVHLKPFTTMRVYLATQILSNDVNIGFQTYVEKGRLPDDVLATAAYCKFFDGLFDCFNISEEFHSKVNSFFKLKIYFLQELSQACINKIFGESKKV